MLQGLQFKHQVRKFDGYKYITDLALSELVRFCLENTVTMNVVDGNTEICV